MKNAPDPCVGFGANPSPPDALAGQEHRGTHRCPRGDGLRSRADVSPARIQLGFDVATAMHRSVAATVKYFGKVLTLP
jgi:hypothetical protein